MDIKKTFHLFNTLTDKEYTSVFDQFSEFVKFFEKRVNDRLAEKPRSEFCAKRS